MVPAQCKRREFLACSRYGRKCHTANFGLPLSHAGINPKPFTVTHCHTLSHVGNNLCLSLSRVGRLFIVIVDVNGWHSTLLSQDVTC